MTIQIQDDPKFEQYLDWLSKRSGKTSTEIIKELVMEKYQTTRSSLGFGALKGELNMSREEILDELKKMDEENDFS
ncbi:MAG: hypothetical protein JNK65_01320 [Deltaproteobacteria bacterium]|nr:hypothetical protein [Deltaproteobacteria bacterium]